MTKELDGTRIDYLQARLTAAEAVISAVQPLFGSSGSSGSATKQQQENFQVAYRQALFEWDQIAKKEYCPIIKQFSAK